MYKPLKIIYLNCNFMHINFDRYPKPLKKKDYMLLFRQTCTKLNQSLNNYCFN